MEKVRVGGGVLRRFFSQTEVEVEVEGEASIIGNDGFESSFEQLVELLVSSSFLDQMQQLGGYGKLNSAS
jgi:hypothetical protein